MLSGRYAHKLISPMNYAEVISSISISTHAIVIVGKPPEFHALTPSRSYCTSAKTHIFSSNLVSIQLHIEAHILYQFSQSQIESNGCHFPSVKAPITVTAIPLVQTLILYIHQTHVDQRDALRTRDFGIQQSVIWKSLRKCITVLDVEAQDTTKSHAQKRFEKVC